MDKVPETTSDADVNCELSLQPPQHSRGSAPISQGGRGCRYFRSGPRRNPTQSPGKNKSETIPPPFPWATDRRAIVHSLEYLTGRGIAVVEGESQCKHCEVRINIKHDLVAKFREVAGFMEKRVHLMYDRAPQEWMDPTYPGCDACRQVNCMRPVIADKKRHINWLYLFLGQWLGFCTLAQLKYFCKHIKKHRTGAKDRVLYLSYVNICKQLVPTMFLDQ